MVWVIFDVNNQNSLISLAYIKANDNPLHVFCNYILYLLKKAPNKSLRADLLQDELKKEFGLNMPQQIINNCVRILEKSNEIIRLPSGAGYQIGETSFNLDDFEKTRLNLHEHEEIILQSIVDFTSKQYKKKWTKDDARKYLSEFMDKEGYGAQLFLKKKVEVKSERISPNFYIGRYIDSIQSHPEHIENKYLEEIVNGMMILQGLCLTNDYNQNKTQKFKGTVFYFDTKLILRALGFSWEAQIRSVREMVRLLREKYDAKIGIFPQTLKEVNNALTSAGLAYEKNKPIKDIELRLFSKLYPDKASIMLERTTNIPGLLERELGINDLPNIDWNNPDVQNYNIDTKNIADFIESQTDWRRGSIDFDVDIINQINILRRGDYSEQYGGKKKLPVFVTSNSKLAYTFRDYILEGNDNSKIWNSHALPVISDNMLLYRIWLPFASEVSDMPSLTLARFAYAAQSEGSDFFEKVREKASSIETMEHIDLIDIPEVARKKFEDILIEKTDGDPEQISEEIVAMSYEECVQMSHLSLVQERDSYKEQAETFATQTAELRSQNVELLSSKYVNKLGLWKVLLFGAKWFWLLVSVIFLVFLNVMDVDLICKYFPCFQRSTANHLIFAISFVIQIVQLVLDKIADDKGWEFTIYHRALNYVKHRYVERIERKLIHIKRDSYKNDVIQYCLEHTKVFKNIP